MVRLSVVPHHLAGLDELLQELLYSANGSHQAALKGLKNCQKHDRWDMNFSITSAEKAGSRRVVEYVQLEQVFVHEAENGLRQVSQVSLCTMPIERIFFQKEVL